MTPKGPHFLEVFLLFGKVPDQQAYVQSRGEDMFLLSLNERINGTVCGE